MSSGRNVFVALAVAAGLLTGCSGEDASRQATDRVSAGAPERISALTAAARSAAVRFFDAQARLDGPTATALSSGAAATTVRWAESVDDVPGVDGSAWQAVRTDAEPTVTTLGEVTRTSGGRFRAAGYVRLTEPPPGHAAGETAPAAVTAAAPGSVFVTDLVFTQDGDRLRVDDYRLDDSPYPVSQLYAVPRTSAAVVTGKSGEPAVTIPGSDEDGPDQLAAGLRVRLAHQDLDRTVQYLVTVGPTTLTLDRADFLAGLSIDPAPALGAIGTRGQVLGGTPSPSGDASHDALVVLEDTFPAESGVLRLTFRGSGERLVVVDVAVGALPPLTPRPTNEVRAQVASDGTPATPATSTGPTTTGAEPSDRRSGTTSTTAPGRRGLVSLVPFLPWVRIPAPAPSRPPTVQVTTPAPATTVVPQEPWIPWVPPPTTTTTTTEPPPPTTEPPPPTTEPPPPTTEPPPPTTEPPPPTTEPPPPTTEPPPGP